MSHQMKMLEILWAGILGGAGYYMYLDFNKVMDLYYIFSEKIDNGGGSSLFTIVMLIYGIFLLIVFLEILSTVVSALQNKDTITANDIKFGITKKAIMSMGAFAMIGYIYVEHDLNLNKQITKRQYKNLVEVLKVSEDGRKVAKKVFDDPEKIIYSKYIDFWKKLNKIRYDKYMKEKNSEDEIMKEEMKRILNEK